MSVYVDPTHVYHNAWGPFLKGSCHMFCDLGDEDLLHALAARIGMRRSWFQRDRDGGHYDLVPSKRALAVAGGAVEVDLRRAVEVWQKNREEIARARAASAAATKEEG